MRDLAESCVKKDDSPNAGFDKRLYDEARKRSKESDGFESFRNMHKNVKDVMFEGEGRSDAGTSSSTASNSQSCSSESSSSSSFKIPQGVPNRHRGGGSSTGERGGSVGRGNRGFNRQRRDNRPEKPDFMKNPEKWKRYSLEDVKDVTDSSNSAAAFAFLDDLKKRKEEGRERMEEDGGMEGGGDRGNDGKCPTKIVFKAPLNSREKMDKKITRKVVLKDQEEEEEETIDDGNAIAYEIEIEGMGKDDDEEEEEEEEHKVEDDNNRDSSVVSGSLGSKFVMKEYVVGAGNGKGKSRGKKEKPKIGKEIKLSHLDDEDEEED